MPYSFTSSDSRSIAKVRQFAQSDCVEILVMTIDSFNKEDNVIRQSTDRLRGAIPLFLVKSARPILILDEPQNMESEGRIKALASLRPLMAVRYSATHRNPCYRLTPFEAYRGGLVKRIEVDSVRKEDDYNKVFVRLEEVRSDKKIVRAKIAVHQRMAEGQIKEKAYLFKPGDCLSDKSDRPECSSFVIDEIHTCEEFVRFANGIEIRVGKTQGADQAELVKQQIRRSIETHFRKQKKLKAAGITKRDFLASTPVVTLFAPAGLPFDPRFTAPRANGGGNTVFATANGPGTAPEVRVFDFATSSERFRFLAYDPSWVGGVRVATGDVTGDGVPDIVTAPGPGGGPHVKVFDGVTGNLVASFFAFDPGFSGGLYVAVANGEIVVGAGAGGGPRVSGFRAGWTRTLVGDANGDGRDEIVVGPGGGRRTRGGDLRRQHDSAGFAILRLSSPRLQWRDPRGRRGRQRRRAFRGGCRTGPGGPAMGAGALGQFWRSTR